MKCLVLATHQKSKTVLCYFVMTHFQRSGASLQRLCIPYLPSKSHLESSDFIHWNQYMYANLPVFRNEKMMDKWHIHNKKITCNLVKRFSICCCKKVLWSKKKCMNSQKSKKGVSMWLCFHCCCYCQMDFFYIFSNTK